MPHDTRIKNNFRHKWKSNTILSHHYECQQKPPGEMLCSAVWITSISASDDGNSLACLDGDLLCDAFFTCLECSVIGWLTTHHQPSPPVPLKLFSLSLDMPSKLFHGLSLQRRLRNLLSLVLHRHVWLYPLPFPNRNRFFYQTFQQICVFQTIIPLLWHLWKPNHFIFVCSAHLQVEFRWNCVLMKTNLVLFVALPVWIWTN